MEKMQRDTGGMMYLKPVMAGGISGAFEALTTYPTEYVKTQLQLDEKGHKRKYKGALDCVRQTFRRYGLFGPYRGLSIILMGNIPKSATRFGCFEFFSYKMRGDSGNTLTTRQGLICGLLAGLIEAAVVDTPMETIKVKLINDMRSKNPQFKGLLDGTSKIVQSEGIGGIYKGLLPTMFKQSTNQAIRFYVLYALKDWYNAHDPSVAVPKILIGLFGSVAGTVAVLCNNPVDVVKTRMQGLESYKYKNSADCVIKTLTSEGPFAFYKGTLPRLCRVCIGVSVTFVVYDTVMEILNKD